MLALQLAEFFILSLVQAARVQQEAKRGRKRRRRGGHGCELGGNTCQPTNDRRAAKQPQGCQRQNQRRAPPVRFLVQLSEYLNSLRQWWDDGLCHLDERLGQALQRRQHLNHQITGQLLQSLLGLDPSLLGLVCCVGILLAETLLGSQGAAKLLATLGDQIDGAFIETHLLEVCVPLLAVRECLLCSIGNVTKDGGQRLGLAGCVGDADAELAQVWGDRAVTLHEDFSDLVVQVLQGAQEPFHAAAVQLAGFAPAVHGIGGNVQVLGQAG